MLITVCNDIISICMVLEKKKRKKTLAIHIRHALFLLYKDNYRQSIRQS